MWDIRRGASRRYHATTGPRGAVFERRQSSLGRRRRGLRVGCLRAGGERRWPGASRAGRCIHQMGEALRGGPSIFSDLSEGAPSDAELSSWRAGYYHNLEGHPVACALRFWRRCSIIRELFAGRRVRVAPGRAVVVAVAIRSSDLTKAYGPLPEEICGVNQTAAAAAWRKARRSSSRSTSTSTSAASRGARDHVVPVLRQTPARAIEGGPLSCAADRRPRRSLRYRAAASCASVGPRPATRSPRRAVPPRRRFGSRVADVYTRASV